MPCKIAIAAGGSLPVIAGGGAGRVVTVRGRVACGSHETLSALGRWFGFGLDEIFSSLISSAGCKIPGLVWHFRNGRYGSSPKRLSEAGLAPFTHCSGLHPDRAVSNHVIALARWGPRPLDLAHTKRPFET